MSEYESFRQRLDAILRTREVERVQKFLVAEGQWDENTPSDPTFAMWMMIAGSPTLRELHAEAYKWLVANGHETEANIILARSRIQGSMGKQGGRSARSSQKGTRPRPKNYPDKSSRKRPDKS